MERRNFLKLMSAYAGALVVGESALLAYDRLTHKKVFALGAIPQPVMPRDVIEVHDSMQGSIKITRVVVHTTPAVPGDGDSTYQRMQTIAREACIAHNPGYGHSDFVNTGICVRYSEDARAMRSASGALLGYYGAADRVTLDYEFMRLPGMRNAMLSMSAVA